MGYSALIDRCLDMMAAEKGSAANTLRACRSDLVQGSVVLGGRLEHVDRNDLTKLSDAWASLATATAARKASALRRFFFFLQEEGFRADDPSAALPRPVQRRPLPNILSHEEVDRLFAETALRDRKSVG